MPARVGLVLPPQLLESARAAQLANRQRLLAREARERLGDRAELQARKARAATGLPAWPGAIPEFERERRGRLWSRSQVLARGVLTHGFYQIYGQDLNVYTVNRILRIYDTRGSSYSEYAGIYQNPSALLSSLRHPATVNSFMSDGDIKLATFPVSESSFLLIEANAKTTTPIIDTGVETVVGGFGPAAVAVIAANPYRWIQIYIRTEQNWAIFQMYVLGQDTHELSYRAWLVHQNGVKVINVPQQFIQQATVANMRTIERDYFTGPIVPGGGDNLQPRAVLRITGNTVAFTKAPQIFMAGTYGGVQVPPIVSIAPGEVVGSSFSYATDGALFGDYEEPIIPSDLAAVLANPPISTGLSYFQRFTVTPPNGQTLPRAPIAYLQDLGFSTADLTP